MEQQTFLHINFRFGVALMLVAMTGIGVYTATVRLGTVSAETDRAHLVLAHTDRLFAGLSEAESAMRGYLITGDTVFLQRYASGRAVLRQHVDSLRELLADQPEQLARLARIEPLTVRRLQALDAAGDARGAGRLRQAELRTRTDRGRAVMDSARALTLELQRVEQERLQLARERLELVEDIARTAAAIGAMIAFLIVGFGIRGLRREFSVRRRAETALRESETLLKQFMDTLPIGAYVVDAQGRASFANTTALTMLGRDALQQGDEALTLWRSGAAEPVGVEENPLTQALHGLAANADDLELRVGGRSLPLEIMAAPVFDSDGRVAYAIAAFSDITERKRNQAALRAAKESAELANQSKSDFLARMSHELRTPLNSIIGFANILLKKAKSPLPEKERTYLERILDNGKHLLLLINDILDLSKVEAGKVVIEKELVDLGALIQEVLQQWEGQLRSSSVRLEASVPATALPVFTDRARLRQVLVNLVSNAVKFTEQGSVRVLVEVAAESGRPKSISVVDTGIGIPPGRLEAIFDVFEQAETSTARKYGGTGLGLPISRALCELLGYDLVVASEPGVGTQFTIHLDRARLPLDQAPRPSGSDAGSPLVLVIDHDPDGRTLLSGELEELGCRVVSAFSAEQALALAEALRPQLITLAFNLPGVWQLLGRLRGSQEAGATPVMLLAVNAEAGDVQVLGDGDALLLPADGEAMRRALRRYLDGPQRRVLALCGEAATREQLERVARAEAAELSLPVNAEDAMGALRAGFDPDLVVADLLMPGLDGFRLFAAIRSDPQLHHLPVLVLASRTPSTDELELLRCGSAELLCQGGSFPRDLWHALESRLSLVPG